MDIKEFNEQLREAERLLKKVVRLQDELLAKEIARQAGKRGTGSIMPDDSGRMPWDKIYYANDGQSLSGASFSQPIETYVDLDGNPYVVPTSIKG